MADFLVKSRHSTTYHFRRKVPADLARAIGKTHLVVSLKTGNHRQALTSARLLATQTDAAFMRLRSMSDPESKPDPLEAFAQLPNCRDLIKRAGMQLRIDEMGKELELRESEITAGLARQQEQQKQHAEELGLAARAAVIGAGLVSGAPSGAEAPRKPRKSGKPFKDAIEVFLAGKKPTTQKTYRGHLKHAMAFFGEDADVRYIDQEAFAAYAAKVRGDVPNKTTAGLYITTCAGMLNYFLASLGWGTELTIKRLVEKEPRPDSDARDGFTLEQTEVIFRNAEKYRKTQPTSIG